MSNKYRLVFITERGKRITRTVYAKSIRQAQKMGDIWANDYDKHHSIKIKEFTTELIKKNTPKPPRFKYGVTDAIGNVFDILAGMN